MADAVRKGEHPRKKAESLGEIGAADHGDNSGSSHDHVPPGKIGCSLLTAASSPLRFWPSPL